MSLSKLSARAKDSCSSIPDSNIQSTNGWKNISDAVYTGDFSLVLDKIYQSCTGLLWMKRGPIITLETFESILMTRVSKFNYALAPWQLPEALVVFILLINYSVDSTQRVSMLAASWTGNCLDSCASTDEFLASVSYGKIASVLRKFDTARSTKTKESTTAFSPTSPPGPLIRVHTAQVENLEKVS